MKTPFLHPSCTLHLIMFLKVKITSCMICVLLIYDNIRYGFIFNGENHIRYDFMCAA
ncbi:hypothetical protein B0151_004480 [Salmonella enterica subsp. enterica serovar Albany]|nr:hypothetical protein [Salmonella enterica subsp. enterica serovar Alachua]EDR0069266.1 hypothetical protein [Salmonella enterica subsp. enterica]EDR5182925.1 hypothetical protein [Salmonella enterica subsp. enterica serovar Enteritidis]EDS0699060.1 hypothetical protein [Salmonella enterica subsp. enterica serovar Kentucky]EDS5885948.1 hypothetical protein [Salmonella enterica subsp. enterica serovar Javiana]EDU9721198.1 hypothetical protein [Salmonella enterica subsp. enterica serovar Heide